MAGCFYADDAGGGVEYPGADACFCRPGADGGTGIVVGIWGVGAGGCLGWLCKPRGDYHCHLVCGGSGIEGDWGGAVDCPVVAGPPKNPAGRAVANDCTHGRAEWLYEQYGRGGHVYSRHSGLGAAPGYSGFQAAVAAELRHHSGRYLYADWDQYQPGG